MEFLLGLGLSIIGLVLGALVATVTMRERADRSLHGAFEQERAALQGQADVLGEQLQGSENERNRLRAELRELRQVFERCRIALDGANEDRARLAERASRVEAMESEAARTSLRMHIGEEQIRRLKTNDGKQHEALRAARAQLAQLERAAAAQQARLDSVLHALREAAERRGVLEQQAGRVQELERQLRETQAAFEASQRRLLELRGSAARESGGLSAELMLLRESDQRLNGELAVVRGLQQASEAQVRDLLGELAAARRALALPLSALLADREATGSESLVCAGLRGVGQNLAQAQATLDHLQLRLRGPDPDPDPDTEPVQAGSGAAAARAPTDAGTG
ncbi:hypothetical protein JI739_01235 [Ramlibacter sp. AW1]|uniref:Uncharacterized protein n=1 Tax=Ramlibacter aurantiacus TaxID=2801330 RepID=A0A937D354_9BURK|nr:hypothetical protein [Ramlibacter aurantiacus]MBL0418957.1 hypothetical protein [Ramlibacter aurantiacus]